MRLSFKSNIGWLAFFAIALNVLFSWTQARYSEGILFASVLLVLLVVSKRLGIWSYLYTMSVIVFLCMHELLNAVGLFDNLSTLALMGGRYSYGEESLVEAKKSLLFFLTGSALGISLISRNRYNVTNTDTKIRLGIYKPMFFLVLGINIIAKLSIYINSRAVGYVQAIHGTSQSNILFTVCDILYPVLFALILKEIIWNKRKVVAYGFLFLVPYFILFISGFRGELIGKVIAVLILYSLLYRFNIFWLVTGAFLGLFASLIMEFLRFDSSLAITDLPLDAYIEAFMFAGNSFAVVPLTIENASDLFHGWKYFFGGPYGVFSFSETYTVEGVLSKPYLPQHLTYIIDRNRFLGGSTIGGSILAEIYLITPKLTLLISSLIPIFTSWLLKNSLRSALGLYVTMSFMENLIFIPRGGFLKFIDKELVIALLILGLIYILEQTIYLKNE